MKRAILFVLCCLPMLFAACGRPVKVSLRLYSPTPGPSPMSVPGGTPEFAVGVVASQEGEAAWYAVPDGSLPERRAWAGELTAASDTLPLNTYVRVQRVDPGSNGKTVVVRITDNGIRRKGTLIDLNREAAETLGMVSKGVARVRVETLALKNADADKSADKKDVVPKAAEITATPAATKQQEKDASVKQ